MEVTAGLKTDDEMTPSDHEAVVHVSLTDDHLGKPCGIEQGLSLTVGNKVVKNSSS